MEIFKLFESTMADLQPGHNIKHLRRDQLLDNYEASAKTLETLVRAKENEIAYRKDLIKMLEESKSVYDSKLAQAKQDYQALKTNVPKAIDFKSIGRLDPSILNERSTTPPMPPPPSPPAAPKGSQPTTQTVSPFQPPAISPSTSNNHHQFLAPNPAPPQPQMPPMLNTGQPPGTSAIPTLISNPTNQMHWTPNSSQSSSRSVDMDISFPVPQDNHENRSSLDRRLSEFLKTFPNISQAGLVPPSNIDTTKPPPGYYTQQTPQAPPAPGLMHQPPLPPPPTSHHINQPHQHHLQHNHQHSSRR